jgi:hypothetical protein
LLALPETAVSRSVALSLALAVVASAPAADDLPPAVLDLHKSGKLFEKSEFKAVRASAAKQFEARQTDTLKEVWASDHSALAAWLDKQKDLKEELFTAIDPQKDDVTRALAIFRELWKADPDAVAKYPNLAVAVSVVWDQPENVYDYRHHQVRTKSRLPAGYLGHGPKEEFKYHVGHARALQGKEAVSRLEVLPWEFLVYVVDHRTPVEEREWAVKNYLAKRPMIGTIYGEVEYDQIMLRTQSETCKLNGRDYTLPEIRKVGGVCAMQADFAARVGKSLDVPAAYVRGEGQGQELHAWVMWVEVKSASKASVNFQLESFGRYRGDHYYTGLLKDPQTGDEILDRDMERRLSAAALDRTGKRQADLVVGFFPDVAKAAELDAKKKVQFLLGVLKLSVYNEPAWLELARMCRDVEVPADAKPLVLEQTQLLLSAFARYPDFSWRVAGDLVSLQKDAGVRNRFIGSLAAVYEAANRPDLTCEARLKWADYLGEGKQWAAAATGLAATIKKFPNEGRYIPRMLDKLKDVCKEFSGGKEYLARTYLELMRKVDPKRGDEVTKYFVQLSGDALAFFQAEKKAKEAGEVEQIRTRAGVKGGRKD